MNVIQLNDHHPNNNDLRLVKSMFAFDGRVRANFTFEIANGQIFIKSILANPDKLPTELITRVHWFAKAYNYKVNMSQEYIGREMIGRFYINLYK